MALHYFIITHDLLSDNTSVIATPGLSSHQTFMLNRASKNLAKRYMVEMEVEEAEGK